MGDVDILNDMRWGMALGACLVATAIGFYAVSERVEAAVAVAAAGPAAAQSAPALTTGDVAGRDRFADMRPMTVVAASDAAPAGRAWAAEFVGAPARR
ncbi:MAG: hypothetical protein AAFR16_03390 [Pseudomonadota bacterium]